MVKFYFNRRIVIGFLVALAILSWLAFSSYFRTKELVRSSDMVVHTLDVLYNTQRVLAIATNIELGQRGYTITGNEAFLKTYQKASKEIERHVETLKILTYDNLRQRPRMTALSRHINELIAFADTTVRLRENSFESAKLEIETLRGKQALDSLRVVIGEIEDEEHRLLEARNIVNEKQIEKFNTTFILLLVATGLIILAIFYAINASFKATKEADEKLLGAMDDITDLYDNAPCGYHSLDQNGVFVNANNTLCKWLGYNKSEVIGKLMFLDIIVPGEVPLFRERFDEFKRIGSVYDVEFCLKRKDGTELPVILSAVAITDADGAYIKSRSITIDNTDRKLAETKIKTLNHELEAFTYSVSHDLRAPLRSIDGYSRILQEDYGDKLDAEGSRVLSVVINNARRMGKLIDDLLDFARLGRMDLVKSNVNMTLIANNVAKELADQEKGRHIEFRIGNLDNSPVDMDMIRQVWENLLSNAVKYSGKKEKSIIEVTSRKRERDVVYAVSDNGVGFDMQYLDKLFGVFQRLHKVQDFAGTGVGLAIVKRIIERHQGEVWAEAELNKGATFYFTIPIENGKQ
jgi:PAS domain S-box-containing protein